MQKAACCGYCQKHMIAVRVESGQLLLLQDPSYDPYAFAKVATRTASAEGGSAPACADNVRKFFQSIMSDNRTTSGLQQINSGLNLSSDSQVESAADVLTLANYVLFQWVSAVGPLHPYSSACQAIVLLAILTV